MEIVLIISIALTVIAIVFGLADTIPKCQEEYHTYLSKLTAEETKIEIEALKLEQEKERTKQAIEKTNVAKMEHEKWQKRMEGKY